MHSRSDFDAVHEAESQQSYQRSVPPSPARPPIHHSPHRVLHQSPHRPVGYPPMYVSSPHGVIRASPHRVVYVRSPAQAVVCSPLHSVSPFRGVPARVSPLRLPSHESCRKRARSESISSSSGSSSGSSDYEYSSSSDEEQEVKHHRIESRSKPPSPPKYYPGGAAEEEDIGSSDSDFEDDASEDARYDDLRDFIDFDPKFNKKVITKKQSYRDSDDPLREFLFNHDAKSRKWFRTFAWSAVGSKLAKKKSHN